MRALMGLSFMLALLSAPTSFGAVPSWFPNASCKQAWDGKDKARYDFSTDKSYSAYQARLKAEGSLPRESCYKEWTVLVYMAADNDLNPYALWDLHEMEGGFASGNFAASTLKSDLIVEADTANSSRVRRLHMFQTPGPYVEPKGKDQFLEASIDDIRSPVVSSLSKSRQRNGRGHAKSLEAFLSWGMKAYPAKHYAVIIWGHGQGWAAEPAKNSRARNNRLNSRLNRNNGAISFEGRFGGLAFNETTGDYLSLPSLSRVLKNVVSTTLEDQRPIDLYASDACLMQMAEVAYEISESTRFISGSAQVQSFLGLPYRQLMYELNTGRFGESKELVGNEDEALLLARLLPSLTARSLDPVHGQQGRADKESAKSFTMSSLSSDALRFQLVPALRNLGESLKAYVSEDESRSGDLKAIIKETPNFMGGSRDLGSFLSLVKLHLDEEARASAVTQASQSVLESIRSARESLQMTSVNYAYGSKYSSAEEQLNLLGFKAIGIWLPQTKREYAERSRDFGKSKLFIESPEWPNWLDSLYGQQ